MRKSTKQQIENFINVLSQVNERLCRLRVEDVDEVQNLIEDMQEGLRIICQILLQDEQHAEIVEVKLYQQQLEAIRKAFVIPDISAAEQLCQELSGIWERLKNSVSQIKVRQEVVFLPYKASMWDSLESVWMAADADADCDAYVVPIPYYDKKADQSFGEYHYEANLMPPEVPITHYEDYDFEARRPDVIYIHNPYDFANNVTSVEPRFYSEQLKKYTDCLVYIPYYSTTGGMAESQRRCPAYYHADYIVIQTEKYREFFDAALPDAKFLPFGSPKFDRVIRICNNPPKPSTEWKEKMQGKKVYFYNTSLGGMLANTESFFQKMEYVFNCFRGREDACLLWRPHPLFESTIDSLRPEFRTIYERLKSEFLESKLGIYDTTPDITNTIALCDAYIGDAGTSVTSLFGVAGKPMFILNNRIHSLPKEDDWKGEIIKGFGLYSDDNWKVTQGNKLYHAKKKDYHYHYVCDLCAYAGGDYFNPYVFTIAEKQYVCPLNAQEIIVIENEKIAERISLITEVKQAGAFAGAIVVGTNLYLLPRKYPAIVCYHTKEKKVEYIRGYNDIFVKCIPETGEWRVGGYCIWKQYLVLASPTDNQVLLIDNHTGELKKISMGVKDFGGCYVMLSDGEEIWMLPYSGKRILRWNPITGNYREYKNFPENFICKNHPYGYLCENFPLSWIAFGKNHVYFSPAWGNMFLRLEKQSGQLEEWIPPFPVPAKSKSDYYNFWTSGWFVWKQDSLQTGVYQYFSLYDAKLYEIQPETNVCHEIPIVYEKEELSLHAPGFCEYSDSLSYCCMESAFHTLADFLDGTISGTTFDREKQIQSYAQINASCEGDCGEKVHLWVKRN